ncbi:MAG: dTMP kinase [Armatimonadetes bacterium]|nr:dTMP kinase [Armatimonadota bacterium]
MRANIHPGKLIVVEGVDGSGKSTQVDLLYTYLQSQGRAVYFSEWNSSEVVKSTTRLGKQRRAFTPTSFSLIQAADFADRWEKNVLPLLKAGVIVLMDRYAFTGFARDVARGVDPGWVRNLYSFAPLPDIVFYFRTPLDVAVDRILAARSKIKYYEAGMDLGLSENRVTSFRLFQERIAQEYERMVDEYGFTVIDASLPIADQQRQVRQITSDALKDWQGLPLLTAPGSARR